MLKGYDVSHWNITFPVGDFLIAKASEGETYHDRLFIKHLAKAKTQGVELFGAYHFAKTKTDATKNALNFIRAIEYNENLGKSLLLILDIEGAEATRSSSVAWALKWCEVVENITGVKPIIYTSSSLTSRFKALADKGFGLWVAHYTKAKKPTFNHWKFWALWQFTSKPIDTNYFNGTKEQYLKYCKRKETTING